MENKQDDDGARANFKARHGCEDKGDRSKAGYWACKVWAKGFSKSSVPTAPASLK